ncbi:hypothetical protein LIT25_18365 [Bacillus sp. F19]|nr:hypothetical protein LIT25_18365 [Bacillus sp. F19]
MNLEEALQGLDDETIVGIAKKLSLFVEGVKKHWYISKIVDFLKNMEKISNRIFPYISNETVNSLFMHVYSGRSLSEKQIKELEQYGLLVNSILPKDLKELLWVDGRGLVVKDLDEIKTKTNQSLMLKFVLVLLYLREQGSIFHSGKRYDKQINKMIETLQFDESERNLLKDLIQYSLEMNLLQKQKNKVYFNEVEFIEWKMRDSEDFINDFYKKKFVSRQTFYLLNSISRLQVNKNEWVNISYLPPVTLGLEKGVECGLLNITEQENVTYVQLTPEGWFLAKGERHEVWSEKNLIISSDFELYIPHTYNPFILLDIFPFATLIENDYFIIFELTVFDNDEKLSDSKKNNYRYLYNVLKRNSRYIPEIVSYEFERVLS